MMGLFGKKEKTNTSCCCACSGTAQMPQGGAGVKVLGSGCAKCNALEQATREALEELGMDMAIDHVTDFSQIEAYGVMTTPALVVDGKSLPSKVRKRRGEGVIQKVREHA